MARFQFEEAVKEQLKLRMAIAGPSGSGKTYTALRLAYALASDPLKVGLVDTEAKSARKYIGEIPDGFPWRFQGIELDSFHPENYIACIKAAEEAGLEVLVIDSLSHAWDGVEGLLEQHDAATRRKGGNSYAAWADVTPIHRRLIETILRCDLHLIATMRSKMEYVQEKDAKTGRTTIRKVGMAPVQRAGMEYEFDIVMDMDQEHYGTITKSRCSAVADKSVQKPGPEFMKPIVAWLNEGVRPEPEPEPTAPHWSEDEGQKAALLKRVQELGLTSADVMLALGGVARVSDYPGSLTGALATLVEFAQSNGRPAGIGNSNGSRPAASNWTREVAERQAFKRFLGEHEVTDDEAKAIAGAHLQLGGPIRLFSEWPEDRARLEHVIMGWLLANRPHPDPATHWMATDPRARARFWATVGEQGFDEAKVRDILPSTKAFPGSCDELIAYVLSARPEDHGQMPLLEAEEAF